MWTRLGGLSLAVACAVWPGMAAAQSPNYDLLPGARTTPRIGTTDQGRRPAVYIGRRSLGGAGLSTQARFGRGTYRTLCVRSCDGYFWPISFSVSRHAFQRDAEVCQQSCPNMEVSLYVHANPGAWSEAAVSLEGQAYTDLPAANRFRAVYDPQCRCRSADDSVTASVNAQTASPATAEPAVAPPAATTAAAAPIADPPVALEDRRPVRQIIQKSE